LVKRGAYGEGGLSKGKSMRGRMKKVGDMGSCC